MREAACEARMDEPDAGVGVTLGADVAEDSHDDILGEKK
jgi:hypothetical protein